MSNFLKRLKLYVFSREFSFRRFFNLSLLVFQERILKNSRVIGYPYWIYVDPINICTLKCPLCPTGQGNKARSKGKMSFENFKKVIDEIGDYLYFIGLYNWGESFLNKDIFRMIRYCKVKKIKTEISTNLMNFNRAMTEELVNSELDVLIVSLDGASQKTTEKYQVGIDFDKVFRNMELIIKKKKEMGKIKPFVQWRFLVNKYNEDEIGKARELAKKIKVDKLEFSQFRSDMGKELLKKDEVKFEETKEWFPKNEKYRKYDSISKKRKYVPKKCPFLWKQTLVNWDGSISPCCSCYDSKFDFGNMFKSNFKTVWNNEKYKSARRLIGKGKKGEVNTICSNCLAFGFLD